MGALNTDDKPVPNSPLHLFASRIILLQLFI